MGAFDKTGRRVAAAHCASVKDLSKGARDLSKGAHRLSQEHIERQSRAIPKVALERDVVLRGKTIALKRY